MSSPTNPLNNPFFFIALELGQTQSKLNPNGLPEPRLTLRDDENVRWPASKTPNGWRLGGAILRIWRFFWPNMLTCWCKTFQPLDAFFKNPSETCATVKLDHETPGRNENQHYIWNYHLGRCKNIPTILLLSLTTITHLPTPQTWKEKEFVR